ncbi:spore coat U domain-containing protein [Thermosynechococcus sp. GLH187]|uniref:Csu type fimbrial protein n=1 Tax=unclassified Thermosynechococcus TaxID=2622553 RepID=UPI00287804E7|nr:MULTISPECIES: spore coat U domain-containing protein [unclassified Thermosynechococcus]WNC44752.1 spore coat U domain-containing protein [Thermosynechococcus sp. GLH187]WNC47288.1 spore coat U domain-containing protein [Thermosynechococcus sp. GLH333]WNC49825.1 spore coat U domain-containing protein [Thermosynechococcus sp. GLH87]
MTFSFLLKRILLGLFLTAAGGVLPLLMAQAAKAQTSPQTTNIQIQAKVNPACKITGTQNINFGTYHPLGAHATTPLDAQGKVSVQCLPKTQATIKLSQGNNSASGSSCASPKRQMASGTARLPYGLYKNSTATGIWGCDATNDVEYTASNALPKDFTIYGRIPAGNSLPAGILNQLTPGTYGDTVQVIVSF